MKHNITFTPDAFNAYKEWATANWQMFKKINELIRSIDRPFSRYWKTRAVKTSINRVLVATNQRRTQACLSDCF